MDADFGDEVQEVTSRGTPVSALTSKWDMAVKINHITWVVTVGVPVYDRENPIDGTKQGREAFLAQMRVDNAGRLGMGYRDRLEDKSRMAEPYYKMAPHFTNVAHSTIEEGACKTPSECSDSG